MRRHDKPPPTRLTNHSIIEIPLIERNGAGLPLLLLDDGEVSVFAASYIRNLHFTGVAPSTIQKHVAAIGLMHDFYTIACARPTFDEEGLHTFIKKFYEARRHGEKRLGWPAVKRETAENDLWYITEFTLFCSANFGHIPANPVEIKLVSQLTAKEVQERLIRLAARKKWDMMFHLFGASREGQDEEKRPRFKPSVRNRKRTGKVDHFPPTHVLKFIAAEPSIRSKLCWLLIFFGGIRISELCHIFVRDITFNHKDGTAKVILADPEDASISWVDALGRKRTATRTGFMLDKYQRIPRSKLPSKHPEHAGWKAMAYESQNRREAEVIWLDPRLGQLFWKLHLQYMRIHRIPAGDKNPYYFIALRSDERGEPVKLSNLHKRFDANSKRIGLIPNRNGANPHAGRHFYGYFAATWLRLAKERVQKMMHHTSITSTEVYYRIDNAVVRDELAAAHARLAESFPEALSPTNLLLQLEKEDEQRF